MTNQFRFERRAAQRFDFHLPLSVKRADGDRKGFGFTQDLSGRGAFFYTDFPLVEGAFVELTLVMPAEVTLAENMRVRCRGRVLRVVKPAAGTKIGVAVHLEGYEFLPDAASAAEASNRLARTSALHEHGVEEEATAASVHVYEPRGVPFS